MKQNNHIILGGERDSLAHEVVAVITKKFPQPSSTNTQIGFKLRCGRLYRELHAYIDLYRTVSGALPDEEHLEAAGRLIYERFSLGTDWCRFPNPDEILVAISEFSEIYAAARARSWR